MYRRMEEDGGWRRRRNKGDIAILPRHPDRKVAS